MNVHEIQPVILTYYNTQREDTFSQFVSSYRRHVWGINPLSANMNPFLPPIVVQDQSNAPACQFLNSQYLQDLASLWPRTVALHLPPALEVSGEEYVYNSVQHGATWALRVALELSDAAYFLFLEDDIVFSSRFCRELEAVELPQNCGLYTLYRPGWGFSGESEFPADRFYGTQAVLFPRTSLIAIDKYNEFMHQNWPPGYDIRWSRLMAYLGYQLFQHPTSLVQHIGVHSGLHDDSRFHQSETFTP